MPFPKVTIRGVSPEGKYGEVLIDGVRVPGVRAVRVRMDVGKLNRVVLEVLAEVDIEVPAEVATQVAAGG